MTLQARRTLFLKNSFQICFFYFISLTFFACNTSSKYIVNDWKVQHFKGPAHFDNSPEHQEVFRQFEQQAKLQFNKDGTYMFDLVQAVQKGTWKLDKKTMTLTTTSEDGLVQQSKILEISAEKLVLQQGLEGDQVILELVAEN